MLVPAPANKPQGTEEREDTDVAEPISNLDLPTPSPPPESDVEEVVDVNGINPEDSADLTPENMQALLARAKRAGKQAVKKTRMAFDATKALADSGELSTKRFRKVNENGSGD